jgi:hypothetical protein
MKLSKIILENKKIIHKAEINLNEKDIEKLSEAISVKLEDYLDIEKPEVLIQAVKSAINELIES